MNSGISGLNSGTNAGLNSGANSDLNSGVNSGIDSENVRVEFKDTGIQDSVH